jgi:hypothetical protein
LRADNPERSKHQVPTIDEKLREWEAARNLQHSRRTAIYVSTPIAAGPKFVEWMRTEGQHLIKDGNEYQRALKAEVILPNIQRTAASIELLRCCHMGLIINPTTLEVPGWKQSDFHRFWTIILDRHARRVILLQGWQYSRGCTIEFEAAQKLGVDCVDENLEAISREKGLTLIQAAMEPSKAVGIDTDALEKVCRKLVQRETFKVSDRRQLYKDEVLDHLACTANVAQFVSFAPHPQIRQRFARIIGYEPNHQFASPEEAVQALLLSAPEKKVNIRSYNPHLPEGNPFVRGLRSLAEVMSELRRLSEDKQLYTIVNEVIDESDNGVSGVCYRGLMEFAPDSTPRCVDNDKIETAIFPFEVGMCILKRVYGFEPDLRGREGARTEFSIHPQRRGWNQGHTIIWQSEQRPLQGIEAPVRWPHRFSRMLGDKAFGLLVAEAVGLPVPRTIDYSRRLFPFSFGQSIGTGTVITRPCPEEKEPGYYPSATGWHNPYDVLAGRILKPAEMRSNPSPAPLASIIIQEAVYAQFSGRALFRAINDIDIHGVAGEGGAFMLGDQIHENLPKKLVQTVRETYEHAHRVVGPAGIEWVFDGSTVWVVQLNIADSQKRKVTIDKNIEWEKFQFSKGKLEDFRRRVMELRGTGKGIIIIGDVSPLSHLGEIAENQGVPVQFAHQ